MGEVNSKQLPKK